jgi:hypothetical protein
MRAPVACRRTIDRRDDEEVPAYWQAQDVVLGRQRKAEQARVVREEYLRGGKEVRGSSKDGGAPAEPLEPAGKAQDVEAGCLFPFA